MNDKTLEEIRDSLKRIEELATPIVIVSPIASPSEVDQLREQLKPHRLIDVKGVDPVYAGNVGKIGHVNLPAEALAQKQKLFSGLNTNREVLDIVNAINALAISNQDVIEIHTGFVANVNWFETIAYVKGCQYEPGANRLFQKRVRLGEEDAFAQLLAIESEITELVIEAREEAEAKAEVEA